MKTLSSRSLALLVLLSCTLLTPGIPAQGYDGPGEVVPPPRPSPSPGPRTSSGTDSSQNAPPSEGSQGTVKESHWTKAIRFAGLAMEPRLSVPQLRLTQMTYLGRDLSVKDSYNGFWHWLGFGVTVGRQSTGLLERDAERLREEAPFGLLADSSFENSHILNDHRFPSVVLARKKMVGLSKNDESPEKLGRFPAVYFEERDLEKSSYYAVTGQRRLFLVVRESVRSDDEDLQWRCREAGTVVLLHETHAVKNIWSPGLKSAMREYWESFATTADAILVKVLRGLEETARLRREEVLEDLCESTGVIRLGLSQIEKVDESRVWEIMRQRSGFSLVVGGVRKAFPEDELANLRPLDEEIGDAASVGPVWCGKLGRFLIIFDADADQMLQIDTRL